MIVANQRSRYKYGWNCIGRNGLAVEKSIQVVLDRLANPSFSLLDATNRRL